MSNPHIDSESPTVVGRSSQPDGSGSSASGVPLESSDMALPDDEKTVISSGTPTRFHHIPAGLHPRELGQLLVGQRLDDLWLEEYVGGGGMGAVFRAVDTKLHRNVAVKVLSTQQSSDVDTVRRFQVEAQSAARLDHPNIARVHYVGEDRGVPYIVFEYIEGTNLRDLVHRSGPLPVADAVNFTIQIADALLHAWQRNVVHRDIKPSNILVTAQGQAKLVDMGLARLHQMDHGDGELTSSGMTLGTFDYIAPEQARNPKDADTRSDIYSLGCTLYFMLTGQPPFSGGTPLQKLLQHQAETPAAVDQFRDDVPPAVVNVLEVMLAKRIEDRFQNPGELLATLTAAADQYGIGHVPVNVPPVWSTRTISGGWLRRHAQWVVPVALLLVGVLGIELVLRGDQQPAGFSQEPLNVVPETDASTNSIDPVAAKNGPSANSEPAASDPAVEETSTVPPGEAAQDASVPLNQSPAPELGATPAAPTSPNTVPSAEEAAEKSAPPTDSSTAEVVPAEPTNERENGSNQSGSTGS